MFLDKKKKRKFTIEFDEDEYASELNEKMSWNARLTESRNLMFIYVTVTAFCGIFLHTFISLAVILTIGIASFFVFCFVVHKEWKMALVPFISSMVGWVFGSICVRRMILLIRMAMHGY